MVEGEANEIVNEGWILDFHGSKQILFAIKFAHLWESPVIISIHFCVQSGEAPKQMRLFTSYAELEGPLHFFFWSWDKRGRPWREQPTTVRLGHQQSFHQWFHQWFHQQWLQLVCLGTENIFVVKWQCKPSEKKLGLVWYKSKLQYGRINQNSKDSQW